MISHSDCAHQKLGHLSCSDLGRAQNAGPTKSAPLRSTQVPEPEQLRPGKCTQPRPASDSSWQSNQEPEQCRLGKHTHSELGQTQCGLDTASTCQCYLFAAFLPPHSTTEQVSLKKRPHRPLVSGRVLDTEETSKQKKVKQREPTWK